jgi:hypothetical protein
MREWRGAQDALERPTYSAFMRLTFALIVLIS